MADPLAVLDGVVTLSLETREKLIHFHALLLKWQTKINLISPDSIPFIWQRHMVDSLQLLSHISNPQATIIDAGSGGGFPGLLLAIAGCSNMHLIESDSRKCAFLRQAALETDTRVQIHNQRLEAVTIPDEVQYITARAFRPLDELLELISRFVSHETTCLFPKGKNYSKEVDDAMKAWKMNLHVHQSITSSDGVILQLSSLHRREENGKNGNTLRC